MGGYESRKEHPARPLVTSSSPGAPTATCSCLRPCRMLLTTTRSVRDTGTPTPPAVAPPSTSSTRFGILCSCHQTRIWIPRCRFAVADRHTPDRQGSQSTPAGRGHALKVVSRTTGRVPNPRTVVYDKTSRRYSLPLLLPKPLAGMTLHLHQHALEMWLRSASRSQSTTPRFRRRSLRPGP
jgi:hypothetical protein